MIPKIFCETCTSTHCVPSVSRLLQTHRPRIHSLGCARVKKSFLSHFIFTGNSAPVLPHITHCALLVTSIVWTCGILINILAKPKTLQDTSPMSTGGSPLKQSPECVTSATHQHIGMLNELLLKITTLPIAWREGGTNCLESIREGDRLQQKILSLCAEENEAVQMNASFLFHRDRLAKADYWVWAAQKEEFFFSGILIHLYYSVTQASLETECHWVIMTVIDEFSRKI